MGKKNSNKTRTVNGMQKQSKILPSHKRNEVSEAVKNLLKIASEVSSNPKVEWENHLEMVKLLDKIQSIEPVEAFESREIHFNAMMEWIKSNGGSADNVTISKFDNMEYGLKAIKNINEGEIVCSIPVNVMMTLENVHESPLKELYKNDPILKVMGNVALTMFLILERLKGVNSFWYPYIASLPDRYNTVFYFSTDDIKELKFSPTLEPALKHCKNIARQYAYFYQVFQKSDDAASRILRHHFTYQLYRWAVSTVMTRQNYLPSKDGQSSVNALIPLWDMCNHTNGYLSTHFLTDPNRSECLAFRSFREGEQVLIFYGKRPNSDFLLHNGFVYPENEHDSFRLKLGMSKVDPLRDERIKLLTRLGIPPSGDFHLRCGSEPLDENLLAFLRIFNMDEGSLKHWLDSGRIEDLGCVDCALDTKIERKVWNFLFNRIKLLLTGYQQASADSTDASSTGCQLIRKLRALEKKMLESVLEYVQHRLNA